MPSEWARRVNWYVQPLRGVVLDRTSRELVRVLCDTRELLKQVGNNFSWSSWPDAAAAVREIDGLVAQTAAGRMPTRGELAVLFAPTGPIQEVAVSSGWGTAFLRLAARFDAAWSAAEGDPAPPGTPTDPFGVTDFQGPPPPAHPQAAPSLPAAQEVATGGQAVVGPQIEVRNSLLKAGFGTISCVVLASGITWVLVAAVALGDFRRLSVRDYVLGGLAALLALAALYGLPSYLRRLLDRSVKVVINGEGIHDLRPPGRFIRWADIHDVGLSGLRRNGVVVHAKLTLFLRSKRSWTLNVEGLDQTPEFLAAAVRSRIQQ
jgi:hypothetical protein